MKHIKRISRILILVCLLLFIATPAFGIANPDDIAFGTGTNAYYKVFYNVLETGDWLVVAEGWVNYVVTPTDYTAEEAFLFELLNTTDTTTYASTTLQEFGDRPISIYLSAARVTALALTTGTAYGIRITGNPLIFATPTGNTITAHFAEADYVDQALGVDGGVPTSNNLRNGMISMAQTIQTYDTPVDDYWVQVQEYRYLTTTGADIFTNGIPNLMAMCPILFQSSTSPIAEDNPDTAGAYGNALSPINQWGATVANGLSALGSYMGISQGLAGSLILFVVVIALAIWIYQKTESGITVLLLVAATPFMGAWLGLMPIALAFVFTIVIIVLLGYFFFSRGAL